MNVSRRSSSDDFFIAGGTLPASAPSYVSRPADEQLFKAALAGEFCYVLTTRQMGKSSLMVRTADSLKEQGIRTAIVDLTGIGRSAEDTWYLDFLTVLADKLALDQDVEAWWREHAALGAVLRFRSFLREVVLTEIGGQIVVFVDEIDSTLGLPFADDFFAAVRATYNERADDAEFKRLTFIFLGVAAPADLIKDRTRTPFNIGQGILLRDFDRTDATVLQQGLEAVYPGQSKAILDRIYDWTSGHPYLTQKLCREVVDAKRDEPWTPAEVDQVVNALFLSDQTNREQNLQFVQDRVLKNPHRRELLKLYGKVRAGKPVANDEQSVLQNQLKLAGLVTTEDSSLRVHNEIYRVVFDAKWITANTPRDSNRIVAYAAVALAALVVGLAGFILLRNSYVQQESDRLQLEFTQVGTSYERLVLLAQLFGLQGILNASNFDDAARRLFFDMNSRQDQLALFRVQDSRVVGVIEGLYTALADANNRGDNDELLKVMRDALQKQGTSAEALRLYQEIDYWLKARAYARQNQYNDALDAYGKAIQANPDDGNPATHFERAQVMLGLPSPVYPQALSDLDAAVAAARKVSEAKPGEVEAESDGVLDATLTPTPTKTASSIPNATVGPTVLPTLVATSRQTPVPVPTPPGQLQLPPPPDAGQRPFRSQFITFVQIASAVRRLIDSNPGLVAFLANSAQSDYVNLRVANLVRTLTPTAGATQLTRTLTPAASGGKPRPSEPAVIENTYNVDRCCGPAGTQISDQLDYSIKINTVDLLQLMFESDSRACSDIRLHIFFDDAEIYTTEFFGPVSGKPATGWIDFESVSEGDHTLILRPEGRSTGQPGDCNNGTLGGWGGTLTAKTVQFIIPGQDVNVSQPAIVTTRISTTAAVSNTQNETRKTQARSENPLIALTGGQIVFGTDNPNPDRPLEPVQQTLSVAPFAIEQMEVTNDIYRLCVEAEACDRPKDTRFFDDAAFEQHPVAFVTASQAAAYCAWIDRRLPTEIEWERAARGLAGRAWPWGAELPTPDRANLLFGDTAPIGTQPTRILEEGRSPEGVYDLIGNVAEWTSTALDCATQSCARGVWDGQADTAVLAIRGGGFSSGDFVRSTLTLGATPDSFDTALGFRCAQ